MSNRHSRRSDLAVMRSSGSLLTFLVSVDDARLRSAPQLRQTADRWLDGLSVRVRHCILCSEWLVTRDQVGLLLLAVPAGRPSSVQHPAAASARAVTTSRWRLWRRRQRKYCVRHCRDGWSR